MEDNSNDPHITIGVKVAGEWKHYRMWNGLAGATADFEAINLIPGEITAKTLVVDGDIVLANSL